ncbi:MAG: serine/threonine-protein kinase, partial [Rubripirellula sp.]
NGVTLLFMSESPSTNDPLDEAFAAYLRTCDAGELSSREEFIQQFPEFAGELKQLIEAADILGQVTLSGNQNSNTPGQAANAETIGTNIPSGDSDPAATLPMAHRSKGDPGPTLPFDLGDYMLMEIVGRGGMGVVYLAKQHELDRNVAVKMIRSGMLADAAEVRRFYTEAQAAARLHHRGIVGVHQFGRRAGHHFFSMEYIRGTDLQRKINGAVMEPKEAARYVRDVAVAIHHAHQNGVLHRDLKPANVLIDEQDQIHVTDFGLAKHMDSDSSVTGSGAAIGTPHYMAPEQAGGHSDRACRQSDVYSLGAILFACVTGRPPIVADTVMQTLVQVVHHPAPSARSVRADVPIDLETIIAKCLEKNPAKRYESGEQLAKELDAFLEDRPIEARPRSSVLKAWHWFEGVPVVGALTGRRVLHSSTSHRRFQAAMLLMLLLSPLVAGLAHLAIQQMHHSIPAKVIIAGGVDDGVYIEVAELLKESISSQHSGVVCEVIPTEGSKENADLLEAGKVHLACIQEGSSGHGMKVVAPLHYEYFYVFSKEGSGIESIEQLEGRRVALGPPGGGSRKMARQLLSSIPGLLDSIEDAHEDWNLLYTPDAPGAPDAAIICMGEGSELIDRLESDDRWKSIPLIDVRGFPSTALAMLMARPDTPDDLVTAALEAWYAAPDRPGMIPFDVVTEGSLDFHPAAKRFYERPAPMSDDRTIAGP